ncbi:hypothetical protein D3C80_704360 [compost metagenome]
MPDGIGEALGATQHGSAGVGQRVGVTPVQVDGQRAVLPLNDGAVRRHIDYVTLRVGHGRDAGSRWRVIAARRRVKVINDVAALG